MSTPFYTGQIPTAADFNALAVKADLAASGGAAMVGYGSTTVAAALAAVTAPSVTSVAGREGDVVLAVADVTGAASLNGASGQNFSVAPASGPAHAIPLAQADSRYAAIGSGGGGGGVSSVGLNLPADFTVTGSPVTGSGVLTAIRAAQTAKYFLASPTGATGVPVYRPIAAGDVPTLNQNTTGTASNVTGVVAIGNGGTGQTTAQTGLNALSQVASAVNGHVLTKDSVTGNATWKPSLNDSGSLSVTQFGVNGSTTDPANMSAAITAAITQGKKLTAPNMIINMGTTTLVFPPTMPQGFSFECDARCVILYMGTGDAVRINSVGFAAFKFGCIIGGGGANGLRIRPDTPNPNFGGQTAVVCCNIFFNTIQGFYCGVYADCTVGAVCQDTITGNGIIVGQAYVPTGSMHGQVCGIKADGSAGLAHAYQGMEWDINYIVADPNSYNKPATQWVGIIDGNVPMGDSNTVNTYKYGAIDGIVDPTFTNTTGVITYGNQNLFIGSIIDLTDCVVLESTSFLIHIVGPLSCFSKAIIDRSTTNLSGFWHWTWAGASEGRNGDLVGGLMPSPLSPPFMVTSPTSYPGLGGSPTIIPMAAVAAGGNEFAINAFGGIRVNRSGVYTLKAGGVLTCSISSSFLLGIGINGTGTIVAAASAIAPQGVLSCSRDVFLNANDVVYLGALSSNGGSMTPSAMNSLSIIGPLR